MRSVCALLVFTLLLGLTASWAQDEAESNDPYELMVGRWIALVGGKKVTLAFGPEGELIMELPGKQSEGSYAVDFSSEPAQLDLSLDDELMSTIIEWVDSDHLRIEVANAGPPRPTEFSPQAVIFTRDFMQH